MSRRPSRGKRKPAGVTMSPLNVGCKAVVDHRCLDGGHLGANFLMFTDPHNRDLQVHGGDAC